MNRLPFLLHLVKDNQRYFFHTISPWLVWWLSLLWFGFVHPFLFLVLQQRQKTNHTSPSTSPGILLTTLSPRGRQSKILSSVLFHLRCPPWSLKEEYHNFFLILPFPPRGASANEFENSCDLHLQYLSWILPSKWSPYLLKDWKILLLHFLWLPLTLFHSSNFVYTSPVPLCLLDGQAGVNSLEAPSLLNSQRYSEQHLETLSLSSKSWKLKWR